MPTTTRSTRRQSRIEVFAIRSGADLEKALDQIGTLMESPNLDQAGEDRLEVLSTLVEAYENEHEPIPPPTAADAILFRLDQLGLTIKALEPVLGTRARVYEILHGTRTLSAQMMIKLNAKFGVPFESLITATAKRRGREKGPSRTKKTRRGARSGSRAARRVRSG